MAVLHSAEDGFLKKFFDSTKDMTPEQRAEYLEKDDVSMYGRFRYLVPL